MPTTKNFIKTVTIPVTSYALINNPSATPSGNDSVIFLDEEGHKVKFIIGPASSGSLSPSGSPALTQLAVFSSASTVAGYAGLTSDSSGNLTSASLTTGNLTSSGQATMNRTVSPGATVNTVLFVDPSYALVAGETAFAINGTFTNSGSVTPNVGDHAFGIVGRFIDSATGKTNAGGLEGRVDGAGTAAIYEAGLFLANFVGASFNTQTLYGITVQNSITTNGSTPLVSGTNVGIYLPPLVGGAVQYGIFTSNNTQSANLTAAYVSGVSGSPPTGSYATLYHDNDSSILSSGGGASGHLKLAPATGAYVFVSNGLGLAPLTATQNALGVTGFSWALSATTVIASTSIGYLTGAGVGGIVVQATNKSTGVTLSKITGQITTNNAALAATTTVTFLVTNTTVAAGDVPVPAIVSGNATAGTYQVWVEAVAAGSFKINLRNMSAGPLSEALVINFVVIKGSST